MSQPSQCPAARFSIQSLAERIRGSNPALSADEAAQELKASVNLKEDRLPKEHAGHFTPEDSISAYEAYSFVRSLAVGGGPGGTDRKAAVGRGLQAIFFGGSLKELPAPHEVKVVRCHDGDTCTIVEDEPTSCGAGPATANVRISGIDAPEVGSYNERQADAVRGDEDYPYRRLRGRRPPRGVLASAVPAVEAEERGQPWINSKLVENVDKIHRLLAGEYRWRPKGIEPRERIALNAVIAATHIYAGKIAGVVANDLIAWKREGGEVGAAILVESQIRWTSDDTPAPLCGSWQPHDIYARRLGGFLHKRKPNPANGAGDTASLYRYIEERLSKVMEEKGADIYEAYRERVEAPLDILDMSRSNGVKDFAREFRKQIEDGALDPRKMYSAERCALMRDSFVELGNEAQDDIQAMQVIIGQAYDYQKYRNQFSGIYRQAGEWAREKGYGFWGEKAFDALWRANRDIPRYHPPDCMKR